VKLMLEDLRYNRNQRGVTAILVALLMVVFLGLAALAVDISHLYVVRNELQNAADAGALAGTRVLYDDEGTAVNPLANQVGHDAAEANRSENISVEVNWTGGNDGDVQRGHWSFGIGSLPRGFYPNDSLLPADLWNATTQELDQNLDFINAVKVTTRRETTPAASFFASILGHLGFRMNAEAVAYIGFAGTITPWALDQPIAICEQAVRNGDGEYDCSTGRMINSGASGDTHNSAAWTNLSQPCSTANVPSVRPLVCGDGNPAMVTLGAGIGTTNGMQDTVFNQLRNCWIREADTDGDGVPDQPWKITLPVVCCGDIDSNGKCIPENWPAVSNCMPVRGAVEVQVLWITESGEGQVTFPRKMRDDLINFSCPSGTETECWNRFTSSQYFNLKNFDGSPAQLEKKSIYFKPDCQPHIPAGNTGGPNFGILARIPVLVK
jgi:hypothetical protein